MCRTAACTTNLLHRNRVRKGPLSVIPTLPAARKRLKISKRWWNFLTTPGAIKSLAPALRAVLCLWGRQEPERLYLRGQRPENPTPSLLTLTGLILWNFLLVWARRMYGNFLLRQNSTAGALFLLTNWMQLPKAEV